MAVVDPVFEITPNAIDSIRRSGDPSGTEGLLIVIPGGLMVNGQTIDIKRFGDLILSVVPGALVIAGQTQALDSVYTISRGRLTVAGQTFPNAGGEFTVPTITFIDGGGDQAHDLRQYYESVIPENESVIGITRTSGTLPATVEINVSNESLDFTDGAGDDTEVQTDIEIEVQTALIEIATFTLVES